MNIVDIRVFQNYEYSKRRYHDLSPKIYFGVTVPTNFEGEPFYKHAKLGQPQKNKNSFENLCIDQLNWIDLKEIKVSYETAFLLWIGKSGN